MLTNKNSPIKSTRTLAFCKCGGWCAGSIGASDPTILKHGVLGFRTESISESEFQKKSQCKCERPSPDLETEQYKLHCEAFQASLKSVDGSTNSFVYDEYADPDDVLEEQRSFFYAGYIAYAEKTAWQPIETAPKDGTTILASTASYVVAVGWDTFHQCWLDWSFYEPHYPTHWMPLPKPPQTPA